jgi:hypothetical protein
MEIIFRNQWRVYNTEEKIDIFEFDLEWYKKKILFIELSILGLEINIYLG